MECATLRRSRDDRLLKLKLLETDFGESLNVLSEPTAEFSSMISKQFEIEAEQGPKKISAYFKYESANVSGILQTSLLESTSGEQREIANSVTILSGRLASVRETISVKPSSVLKTSAAVTDTAPSTSAGASSKESPQ